MNVEELRFNTKQSVAGEVASVCQSSLPLQRITRTITFFDDECDEQLSISESFLIPMAGLYNSYAAATLNKDRRLHSSQRRVHRMLPVMLLRYLLAGVGYSWL